ncbi:MAG: dockerin type I repeat-containing protein [Pirellulaceae bacterium]
MADVKYAQQFFLGDQTNIDQVTVLLTRPQAGTTGDVRFELWRDDGNGRPMPVGDPTGKIADLGSVLKIENTVPVGSSVHSSTILFWGSNPINRTGLSPIIPPFAEQISVATLRSRPSVSDPPGSTANGAGFLRGYQGSSDPWLDLTDFFGLSHFYQALKIEAMEVAEPQTVALFDNLEFPFDKVDVGPRFDSRRETLAQQFVTGNTDNISSIALRLQRVGSPSGNVMVEIWEDGGQGEPGTLISTVGSFDVATLSTTPEVLEFDALITQLSPNSRYHLVLNNEDTNISSANNSYKFGVRGHTSDVQDEGTNGAAMTLVTDTGGNWRILSDPSFFGCNPTNGHCPNFLHMSIEAVQVVGDWDFDGEFSTVDIDMLSSQVRHVPSDRSFDLNNDGMLDQTDRTHWVHNLANTFFGDANLDGEFNSSDMTLVFSAAEYEDNITLNSTWAEGDWNGDGDFDSSDLILAFQDGGYEQGPRAGVQAVPEPASSMLWLLSLLSVVIPLRRIRNLRS